MRGVLAAALGGSVLIVLVLALRLALQSRLPRRLFPALWCVAAVRLLLPLEIPTHLSVWNLLQKSPAVGTMAAFADALPFPALTSAAEQAAQSGAAQISPILLIWLGGAALLGLYFAVGYVCMTRTFRASNASQIPCAALTARFHPTRAPRICVTQSRRAPLTFGILRPVILLPDDLPAGSERFRLVLAHELAHVRRCDCLRKLLLTLCLCVYWWNPLVWCMVLIANRDMELACDEVVLCTLGADIKKAYALTLLDMAQRKTRPSPLCSGFARGSAETRIRAILRFRRTPAWAGVCAAVVFFALGCALTTQAVQSPVPAPEPAPVQVKLLEETPQVEPVPVAEPVVAEPEIAPDPAPTYVFPLENADAAVELAYGWHTNEQTGASAFHDGVDLEAESGASVLAVADGTVLSAEFEPAYGYILTLAHASGVQTFYAHLSEFCVAPGETVRQGQIIAKTGESGWATAPHLHLGTKINNESADPLQTLANQKA